MARLIVLLIKQWATLPWTRGENACLRGVYRCLYRGLWPIAGYAMATLSQRSAALVAGGFWWILLADRRRSRRASRSESFFKILAGTLALPGFLCALAIPFIANEWTCRGGGGVRPTPPPPELYREPVLHIGRNAVIRQ